MKKISHIFFLAAVLFQIPCKAQGFRTRCYTPNGLNHTTKDIFEISPGSYFGIASSLDTLNANYRFRLSVVGLNATGQVQWIKSYGTAARQYANSPTTVRTSVRVGNHIYYAGSVAETNYFYGVLVKFDLNGDTLWQKCFKVPGIDMALQKVSSSVDGGFLLTGYLSDNINGIQPCILIKTDANGNELWRKTLNKPTPNASDGKAILQDAATKKIVIGGFQNIGTQSSFNSRDNIIILDSLGVELSRHYFNTGQCHDLIQTQGGKIVAVGRVSSGGAAPLYMSFALKLDINNPANPIWRIDNFGPLTDINTFCNIVELPNGNLLIAGGIDSLQLLNNRVNALSRFVWVSSAGQVLKVKDYDYASTATSDNAALPICLSLTSDGGWITSLRAGNPGKNPMFFVKYDANGCDSTTAYCATVGIDEQAKEPALRFWPNPASDFIEIGGQENFTATLTDLSGREVLKEAATRRIDVQALQPGIYFISLSQEGRKLQTRKLIISR